MSELFQSTRIGTMDLRNRFVRSATWEGMATESGEVTDTLIQCMSDLAHGRVGLIITGHAYVQKEGQASPFQLGVHRDELLGGLTDMALAVKKEGAAICLQLAHGGVQANAKCSGEEPRGPSAFSVDGKQIGREMTLNEIAGVVRAFGEAAGRAAEAGYDAVQIHAAHGYLISQFLSPTFNTRKDEYGGDILGRARLLQEVVVAVREAVGPDKPVLVKLNSDDFLDGGMSQEESLLVCRRLENMGVDAVELSGGTALSGKRMPVRPGRMDTPDQEAWYRETAKQFKAERALPLILVGGVRSLDVAETLVADGYCDYVALARPLIREPGLIRRWMEGDTRPSGCVSDNLCFRPGLTGKGIYCVTEEREKKKDMKA